MVPRLLAISPPRTGPWVASLNELAELGVPALLVRLVDEPDALGVVLAAAARTPLRVLVRPVRPGDADLATAAGLGLHLPDIPEPTPPATTPAGALRSRSCHDPAGVETAAAAGFDLCTLAPVFPPGSKPGDTRPTLGIPGLAAACAAAPAMPVLALGGVRPAAVAPLVAAGAHGVAGITGFFAGLRLDRAGTAALVRAVSACHPAALGQ
jgi:thiamine monophosphate synthase